MCTCCVQDYSQLAIVRSQEMDNGIHIDRGKERPERGGRRSLGGGGETETETETEQEKGR